MVTVAPAIDIPPDIKVGRVFTRPPESRNFTGDFDDVRAWLAGPARRIPETVELLDELCWRLLGAGVPLARVAVSLPTLHPQYSGTGCRWLRDSGQCIETLIGRAILDSQMYRDSPLRRVFELGETVRRRLEGPDVKLDFPILNELKESGATDYIAMPLELSDGKRIAVTLATDASGGFQRDQLVHLLNLTPIISPLIEIQIIRRITGNLLDAYLGRQTGQRVLAGEIVRGQGELIRAVIWLCDIRNFTPLSERLEGDKVIAILDACFERVVDAVQSHGGEVLKFMGDGLLAIFPMPDAAFAPDATGRALDAAVNALKGVDALNGDKLLAGEPAPRMCVSLHVGDIMYGNIGAADRLDFTAIGPSVNLVSRLDQLTKVLNRRILVTGEFADVSTRKLVSLGKHELRGLSETYEIFTLPEEEMAEAAPA